VDGRCESLFHDSLFPCAELHVGASMRMHVAKTPLLEENVMRHALASAWPSRLWWCVVATTTILPWSPAGHTARATDIEEYNFNTSPSGWTSGLGQWEWTDQGSNEKSWKVLLSGTNPSANYLYSPCLTVTDTTVRFDFQEHRFKFGTSGTVAPITYVPPAGQVQYTLDGITWQGIPLALWSNTGPDVPPTLNPADLLPTTTALLTSGYAFQGMSAGYDQSNPAFIKSGFDLSLTLGSSLQFRLLGDLGGQVFLADPDNPPWDVDNIQIKGVVPGPCVPEPGTLALLGIGGGLIVLARLRRTPRGRALGRSTVMGIVVAVAVVAAALAIPPAVKADVLFDFQVNQNGNVPGVTWTESQQGNVAASKRWIYYPTGDKRWGVLAAGADSITSAKAAHLTSSTFSGIVDGGPAQNARISLAHNFFLPPSGTGGPRPISLGQLQYQINNSGTWVGLPLDAFTSGGDLNIDDPVFGPSPFKNPAFPIVTTPLYVDQTAFVPPTYVTSTTAPLIPYVAPGGASFVGQTTGWSSLYVPSQAFLNINTGLAPEGITSMQLRLTNASLGGNCINNEGWNVRMLSVEFDSVQPPVPEPATLALALVGGGAACAARALRRRRSPAALEAE
jgi:hypothetical protein